MANPMFGIWPGAEPGVASDLDMIPKGLVLLALGTGAESIVSQVGNLITGITVAAVGNYNLAVNPEASYDVDRVFVIAQPYDLGSARTVIVYPDGFENTLNVRVYLANGTATPVARVALAIFYDPQF
jgi:hypothetical protein